MNKYVLLLVVVVLTSLVFIPIPMLLVWCTELDRDGNQIPGGYVFSGAIPFPEPEEEDIAYSATIQPREAYKQSRYQVLWIYRKCTFIQLILQDRYELSSSGSGDTEAFTLTVYEDNAVLSGRSLTEIFHGESKVSDIQIRNFGRRLALIDSSKVIRGEER